MKARPEEQRFNFSTL